MIKSILLVDKNLVKVRAVSYTHLDVYKRQPLYTTNLKISLAILVQQARVPFLLQSMPLINLHTNPNPAQTSLLYSLKSGMVLIKGGK